MKTNFTVISLSLDQERKYLTLEGRAPAVCWGLSSSAVLSLTLFVYACHPHDTLLAHWAWRVFSGPWGIVVVRASWLRYPTLIKKKKNLSIGI
jgi:hypothetical protein